MSVLTCVLLLFTLVQSTTTADQAQHVYDDLGRLSQMIDGQGNVATYNYDAVGNLLSITRNLHQKGHYSKAFKISATTPSLSSCQQRWITPPRLPLSHRKVLL
jgi:YD repeat-containing protein